MRVRDTPWFRTPKHRQQAREAITAWNEHRRDHGARCGARRKYDGEACRQFAMANGRCRFHGGRVGRGEQWHKPRWPKKTSPSLEQKLARKLRALERQAVRRERWLAGMTPERRAKYDAWKRTHLPGSLSRRKAIREEIRQNAEARALMERARSSTTQPTDPEYFAIEARLAELRARQHELRVQLARSGKETEVSEEDKTDLGVFG
jgi:hypothetical protein